MGNIVKEAKSHRRNLVMVWLDYKKAFDFIPHSWLLKSLKLAKVPDKILQAIDMLTKSWKTVLYLQSEDQTS